jgi:hypothetical protein
MTTENKTHRPRWIENTSCNKKLLEVSDFFIRDSNTKGAKTKIRRAAGCFANANGVKRYSLEI